MPTYQYRCRDCGTDLEVFQKFSDDALTVCPECKGELRKIFSPSGIIFKGSGFYSTDNSSSKAASPRNSPKPAEKKTESKPAAGK
ncbi:FmdB family zinc ribbon protein [Propionimicrobium sp. BV2F7]|uniref:FmdB family zinc ribbon protein n=1 Tax=Propionimicrobium sp. BV2F7 TaxID=1111131 RepID=UPI0003D79995|nr:FmdB family zinc ribbon protein [Propionimicrobium sp. BV2F7]ETJ98460.1 zinc ribbon domain protein [Propionimicrobium sp. BV2F7]